MYPTNDELQRHGFQWSYNPDGLRPYDPNDETPIPLGKVSNGISEELQERRTQREEYRKTRLHRASFHDYLEAEDQSPFVSLSIVDYIEKTENRETQTMQAITAPVVEIDTDATTSSNKPKTVLTIWDDSAAIDCEEVRMQTTVKSLRDRLESVAIGEVVKVIFTEQTFTDRDTGETVTWRKLRDVVAD